MKESELAWLESHPAVEAVVEELTDIGALERVALGGIDEQLWSDCDLAIFAEHRLGDRTDPRALDAERRNDWCARATTEPPRLPSARKHDHSFWLRADGERVGTVALARSTMGGSTAYLSSLYVLPTARRQGHVRRVLTQLHDALGARGLGLRLETCWAWQDTLRVYLRLGMWVRSWKRDLSLQWGVDAPSPIIEVGDHEASMSIVRGGTVLQLCRARREGDRLVLEEQNDARSDDVAWIVWEARSTLALVLAMHGWPLVRSAEHWEKSRGSDLGPPEALAYKLTIWESWDRAHGWIVDTPRIPGLEYPTRAELEARWAAALAEYHARMEQK